MRYDERDEPDRTGYGDAGRGQGRGDPEDREPRGLRADAEGADDVVPELQGPQPWQQREGR